MKLQIRTLLGKSGIEFSAIGLRSLVRNSAEPLTIVVHSDGSVGEREMDYLRERVDSQISLVSHDEASDVVEPAIMRHPHLQQFRKTDVFAHKILDISLVETSDRIRYCDTDIIFFDRFSGLFTSAGEGEAMFMKDVQSAYAFAWNVGARRFFPLPDSLNAGLIDFPKSSFDLDHLEYVLSTGEFVGWRGWREQTMWASLAKRTRNIWPQGLVIPNPGAAIAQARAWHLVSIIRSGWDADALGRAAERLESEPAKSFEMRSFKTTSYPGYLSQRSRNSLSHRLRVALSRVSPARA